MKKNVLLFIPLLIVGTSISLVSLSCCSSKNNQKEINKKLKKQYYNWYKSLSSDEWNKDSNNNFINYFCSSEQQAIALYANFRGWFWNESLHKQEEPKNISIKLSLDDKKHEIRGDDYKFISQALSRAIVPENLVVWHGVEYQENEFWDQLKDYIIQNPDGTYDYSKIVGKEIESYGFFSTSLSKEEAFEYCDGAIFNNEGSWDEIKNFHLPLKEKVVFEINVKKGYQGAAYLADYKFANTTNHDNQLLIKKNCRFIINKVKKNKDINLFYMDLIN